MNSGRCTWLLHSFLFYKNSIFTAFVLESFLIEYETKENPLTLFETKIKNRIVELGLHVYDTYKSCVVDRSHVMVSNNDDHKCKNIEKLKNLKNKLNDLDGGVDDDITKLEDLRFHLNPKGPKSVNILLQRMFSQKFDISEDDVPNKIVYKKTCFCLSLIK